jgi:chromosome partitioning protein
MRVLAFASQKSGAGKTTLAGHVAVQAQRAGAGSVVLVDADPDGSLTDWFALREEAALQVERACGRDVLTKLQELRAGGAELVVIDTPPALHQSIEESVMAADLVAIPTRPWAHDVAAASATVGLVQRHGKPFVFIVNGAAPEAELSPEVVMGLAQHGTVASVTIPRSLALLDSMLAGQTVFDMPDSPAPASDIARLWEYLSKRLVKGMPTASSAAGRPSQPAAAEAAPAMAAAASAGESAPAQPAPPAAPTGDVPNPEALRRYPRFKYEQPAVLVINDASFDCVVHDISAGGALVFFQGSLSVGDRVTLSLESIGKLPAEVRHREGGRAGLRFIVDPKQQLFLVKHLSAVIASASTTVAATVRAGGH